MLMLQRAAENVNPSECNDPAVLLACSLGSDSCPAACQKKADEKADEEPETSNISDMPIAGDLTVAVADYSSEIKSVPVAGTVVFNAVDFKASEKVVIESVKLERTGLSDKKAIKWVWFEKDGIAVSAKASVSTDGTATTRFYNNFSVNGTETLDLVVELQGTNPGSEVAFNIVGVTSTAKNVSANTKTSTYRTTNYTVSEVTFESAVTVNNTATEYKVGDTKAFEIGKFKLTNDRKGSSEDKNIIVKSLKLKNAKDLDLGDTFKNVYLTRDGKTVSKKVELDGKNMTIYFDDEEIVSGKSNQYTIFAEIAQLNEANKSVQLQLNKESELVANEKTTNFRVTVTKGQWEGKLKLYLFKWGKITFTNDSSLSKTVNAADGSSDVVLGKGTLTVSEPIKFKNITINSTSEDVDANKDSVVIKDLKIEIWGSTYYLEASCPTAWLAQTCTYKYNEEIYVSKTSDVRILANLRAWTAVNDKSVEFGKISNASFGTTTDAWEYDNGNNDSIAQADIAGSIQISKLTVKPGKFNITNKSSATQKVTKDSSDDAVIFDGEITAKDGTVSINELTVAGTFIPKATRTAEANWLLGTEAIDLTLSVNWDVFSTQTLRGGTETIKTFSSLGDVKSGEPMKIKIVAQPNIGVQGSIVFKVGAEGSDAQGNKVTAVAVNAAQLDITDGAEISLASSNTKSAVVKDGSNAEIISFTTTVKNGSYDLGKVVATLKAASDVLDKESITLEIDGQAVASTEYKKADGKDITFADLNETLNNSKQHTIALRANLNASKGGSFEVSTIGLWSTTTSSNPSADKTLTTNAKRLVAKAVPVITSSTSNEDLVLKISNPKDSEETIEIKSFAVDGQVVNVYFDGTKLNLANDFETEISKVNVSLAAGNDVELRIQAAKSSTVTVSAIKYVADTQTVVITSDYPNVGNWSSFKVSAGDKGSVASATLVPDTENGTSTSTAANVYTVTFDAQGGTPTPTAQSVVNGATAAKPANPTKVGYTFNKWQKSWADYDFATPVTANITLDATWTPITYTVKYDLNGWTSGSAIADLAATYDVALAWLHDGTTWITPPSTKTFQEWNTQADGLGTTVTAASKNLTTTDGATVTLYAIYS